MATNTDEDELQSLIPSLSPIMGSGVDPEDVLRSGNPQGYMAAMRSGMPFNPAPVRTSTSQLAASVQPALPPSAQPPSPAGSAAIQRGEREATMSSLMPGFGESLTRAGEPATNAPNPISETTRNPSVPGTVTPSGSPISTPWSQLAKEASQGAQSTLNEANTLANARQPVDVNAIETQRSALASPQTAANPGGIPNPKDPLHPEYRPSAGRRIARGVLGAVAGLGAGGIRGAIEGAVNPAVTTGVGYSAPTSQFSQAAQRSAAALSSLDQQLQQADTQAKTKDQAVQSKIAIASQFANLAKDEAADLNAENKSGQLDATMAKAGMKVIRDSDGKVADIVDDPDSEVYKGRKVLDEYREAQTQNAEAQEELRRAQADPNSPAFKLAAERARTAAANALAAQLRAQAYWGNYLESAYNKGLQGDTLPGAPQISDEGGNVTAVGSRNAGNAIKAQGNVARFNDVYGAIDNLEAAAKAMDAKGEKPDDALVAGALAQPKGTAGQWLQGQMAKANLSPEQRNYVTSLVAAHENIQALRQSVGGSVSDTQVNRLVEMLPGASTPDLDYFLRQTGQIRSTANRLAKGVTQAAGGARVHGTGNTPARPKGVPDDAVWNPEGNGGKGSWRLPANK